MSSDTITRIHITNKAKYHMNLSEIIATKAFSYDKIHRLNEFSYVLCGL